jgi:hypothetical protein
VLVGVPNHFLRKDHWVHISDPETYPLVVNPIVDGAFLPKTLINGGNSVDGKNSYEVSIRKRTDLLCPSSPTGDPKVHVNPRSKGITSV